MTIKLCPHCNQRYEFMEHTGDFVHECNSGNLTLDQEDVVIVGRNVIEFGQTVTVDVQPTSFPLLGINNKLQGTYAEITGDRYGGLS